MNFWSSAHWSGATALPALMQKTLRVFLPPPHSWEQAPQLLAYQVPVQTSVPLHGWVEL
jgi:hypothetical protein